MTEWVEEGSLAVAVVPVGGGADDLCAFGFGAVHDLVYVVDEQSDEDAGGFGCFGAELVVVWRFFVDVEHGSVDFHFGDVDLSFVFEEPEHFGVEHFFIELDGWRNDLDGELWCEK